MIDIHSHVVFGVDDGPQDMDGSIRMIAQAEKLGIKVIIATPHLQDYIGKIEAVRHHFNDLALKAAEYEVTLRLGYEVRINPFIPEYIRGRRNISLDGSRYLLIEFPFDNIPAYTDDTIYKLQLEGLIPVIAHPERNKVFMKNPQELLELLENGCMAQIDAGSVIGAYGRRTKRFTKWLVKRKIVHFAASDAHRAEDYTKWFYKAYQTISRWKDEEYADILFYKNPKMILDSAASTEIKVKAEES